MCGCNYQHCTCVQPSTIPSNAHEIIGRHMLADGLPLVLDLKNSLGHRIIDSRFGRCFLDMFSCCATLPIGLNHPKMRQPEFLQKLERAAVNNPTNADVYTVEMAKFMDTWHRLATPAYLPHHFFISGGAAAVENALKAAFDWKVRKNFRRGLQIEKGHQVLHFREAFHGRSGYTLSLTNTADQRKYQYFAKFDWPRVSNPKLRWPIDQAELERVAQTEIMALEQIRLAFCQRPHDIAAIIIEPIQGEGGDNHFRPEFFRALRRIADEREALLIFDEIQTGMGLTGKMWAHEHFGVQPDILVFGKKTQICGIMAGRRLDEEPDNVFHVASRINSTWGGSLVDMVRCQRYLEIINEDGLVQNAAITGQYLLEQLVELQSRYRSYVWNARGQGLMCAIDLPDPITRNRVAAECYTNGMIILPCGTHGIRFRPSLDITKAEISEAVDILERSLNF